MGMIKYYSPVAALCLAAALLLSMMGPAPAQNANYKVGDRVAAPFVGTQYLDSVVVRVDPDSPYPYRVHPLGYLDTMDTSFPASMLKARGSVATQPVGGMADDPWLMKVSGAAAFHASALYPGKYECWTLSSGGSASLEAAMGLNFEILGASQYRDSAGALAGYQFDAGSGSIIFQGGALDGQKATYQQVSDPPTANQPPTVTFVVSGDSCQRPM
jgi:hypothetical protein